MRYAMAIDLRRCVGCDTCTVACKMSNNLPRDVQWLKVNTLGGGAKDTAAGTYPDADLSYLPVNCMHCGSAPCAAVCPTGAIFRRDNGIVDMAQTRCIGCGKCAAACPYEGVLTKIEGEPQYYLDFKVGHPSAPDHLANTVEKCNFCADRLERGEIPACMELCPGRARYFGDVDDPDSQISKLLSGRKWMRLHEELGTTPGVYYLL